MMDMTAFMMPKPITRQPASTPITATRLSTRPGAAELMPLVSGEQVPLDARMGTFRIKARAPPSRNGAKIPSSQPSTRDCVQALQCAVKRHTAARPPAEVL